MTKDIVLILGGGGMAGVFSAGVLKELENDEIFNRIHSIYAVSVGACNAARFVVKESELGGETYWKHFNTDSFIKKHFAKYFFRTIRKKPVEDLLNFDYFRSVILESDDAIDMSRVVSSIPIYVKVFDVETLTHEYIKIEEPNAYEKVMASATLSPLTSVMQQIDNNSYIDGEVIASDIDKQIIQEHRDKLVIKVVNKRENFFDIFNLPVFCIVYSLFRSLFSPAVANTYAKKFAMRRKWEKETNQYENVMVIRNDKPVSLFCTDEDKLKQAFLYGQAKAKVLTDKIILRGI